MNADDIADLGPPPPVHVFPTWGPEHATDGTPCWCGPEIRREPGASDLIIHRELPQ